MKRLVFALAVVCLTNSASAQWVTDAAGVTTANNVGVGVASHVNIKLRLADAAADAPGGKTQLSFGTTAATWWAFRLNSSNDLYLDRQDSGWKEGVIFAKNGNVGIGLTTTPAARLHVLGGAALIGISSPLVTGDSLTAGTGIGTQRFGSTPSVSLTMARGTEAAPTAVASGDDTGRILFRGFDGAAGSTPVSSARIAGLVDGTVSSGVVPQAVVIRTGNSSTPAERLRVDSTGRVGIGTTTPAYKLHVHNDTAGMTTLHSQVNTTLTTNVAQADVSANIYGLQNVAAGLAAQGTVTGLRAGAWLNGAGDSTETFAAILTSGLWGNSTGTLDRATGLRVVVSEGSGSIATGYGIRISDVGANAGYGIYQEGANDQNVFTGKVTIGTQTTADNVTEVLTVRGKISATQVIGAVYQDIAEWVPSAADLVPGTVVILNPDRTNEVMASNSSYDSRVAGVVSAQPGLILGVEGSGKEQIATTGRVKVRVDARTNAIRVGDLLVTSDVAGTAMKSEPMEINGRKFHQPGTIIGKALEPLEQGTGEILVLLSMQ